jgi:hypothetical protein
MRWFVVLLLAALGACREDGDGPGPCEEMLPFCCWADSSTTYCWVTGGEISPAMWHMEDGMSVDDAVSHWLTSGCYELDDSLGDDCE